MDEKMGVGSICIISCTAHPAIWYSESPTNRGSFPAAVRTWTNLDCQTR